VSLIAYLYLILTTALSAVRMGVVVVAPRNLMA